MKSAGAEPERHTVTPLLTGAVGPFSVIRAGRFFRARSAGGMEVRYPVRRLPSERRAYFAALVSLRQRYGWRVNTTRLSLALEALYVNAPALLRVIVLANQRDETRKLYVLDNRIITEGEYEALSWSVDAASDVVNRAAEVGAAARDLLGEIQSAALAAEARWNREREREASSRAKQLRSAGVGPPPQVADVLTLVRAPRPGPSVGVTVAA